MITIEEASKIIDTWLNSEFLNGRYSERLEMIKKIEEKSEENK